VFVHFGKTFTSTAKGTVLREVDCERCGDTYFYDLVRVTSGERTSHYMLNNRGAADRAARDADKELAEELQSGVDPVPCPHCGWFQARMVGAIAAARIERTAWLWFSVPVWVLVTTGLCWGGMTLGGDATRFWHGVFGATAAAALAFGGGTFWLQWRTALRYNPNEAVASERVGPLPGMPPALRPVLDAAGSVRFEAATPAATVDRQWVTVQLPRVAWPPQCCECAGPAETTFRRRFRVSTADNTLPVPLCGRCNRALRGRALVWAVLGWPIAFLAVGMAMLAVPGIDEIGRLIVTSIAGSFLAVVMMFVLPVLFATPYRARSVDAKRGICRLAFRDGRYANAIADAVNRAADSRPPGRPVLA
jgi:hypothetical protein